MYEISASLVSNLSHTNSVFLNVKDWTLSRNKRDSRQYNLLYSITDIRNC